MEYLSLDLDHSQLFLGFYPDSVKDDSWQCLWDYMRYQELTPLPGGAQNILCVSHSAVAPNILTTTHHILKIGSLFSNFLVLIYRTHKQMPKKSKNTWKTLEAVLSCWLFGGLLCVCLAIVLCAILYQSVLLCTMCDSHIQSVLLSANLCQLLPISASQCLSVPLCVHQPLSMSTSQWQSVSMCVMSANECQSCHLVTTGDNVSAGAKDYKSLQVCVFVYVCVFGLHLAVLGGYSWPC